MQELLRRRADRRRRHRRARRAHSGPIRSACRRPAPLARDVADVPVLPGQRSRDAARGGAHRPAARPTRPAGRCASCRTSTRSSATACRARTKWSSSPPRTTPTSALLTPDACTDVLPRRCATARASISTTGAVHAQPFVNHGKAAGASIEHPHAQLVALDFVPPRVRARLDALPARRARRRPINTRVIDGERVVVVVPARGDHRRSRYASRSRDRRAPLRPRDRRRDPRGRRSRCRTRSSACTTCSATSRTTSCSRPRRAATPSRSTGGSTSCPGSAWPAASRWAPASRSTSCRPPTRPMSCAAA